MPGARNYCREIDKKAVCFIHESPLWDSIMSKLINSSNCAAEFPNRLGVGGSFFGFIFSNFKMEDSMKKTLISATLAITVALTFGNVALAAVGAGGAGGAGGAMNQSMEMVQTKSQVRAQLKSQDKLLTRTRDQLKTQDQLLTRTRDQLKTQDQLLTQIRDQLKTQDQMRTQTREQLQTQEQLHLKTLEQLKTQEQVLLTTQDQLKDQEQIQLKTKDLLNVNK